MKHVFEYLDHAEDPELRQRSVSTETGASKNRRRFRR